MNTGLLEKLTTSISGRVVSRCSLREYTTYMVGGPAEALVIPAGSGDLEHLSLFAGRKGIPLTVLGAGSNVIVPDEGIEGIVAVAPAEPPPLVVLENGGIEAESGMMLDDLIRTAAGYGLGGLTSLAGIPGTVGGALMMNAGTNEGCISDHLHSVTVTGRSGSRETIPSSSLGFGYRSSDLAGMDTVILGASFRLPPGDRDDIGSRVEKILEERGSKFPCDLPSAGSVFKRPEGDYAGRLIEEAGCKGMRVGGAAVSGLHANFIVNTGDATAADIVGLIELVREKVRVASGITLELEQILLPARPAPAPRPE